MLDRALWMICVLILLAGLVISGVAMWVEP